VMLCSRCAFELPRDARWCVKCGAQVDTSANPLATGSTCLDNTQAAGGTLALPSATPPPYALFVSQVLGLALSLSVAAFSAADNMAHGYWRFSPFVISSVAAVAVMLRMPGTWRSVEAGTDADAVAHQRKLLRLSIIFIVLFIATAFIVGAAIGKNGKERAQLQNDFREMSSIGSRISRARNSVEHTVPAHVVMYKSIEDDVDSFDAIMRKIQAELAVYDEKFPGQHDQTARSIQSIGVGLKRASLLKQQIGVARDIESLDPAPRWRAWQDRMQPLLDAEDALDKN
jgi:hypothetical protein